MSTASQVVLRQYKHVSELQDTYDAQPGTSEDLPYDSGITCGLHLAKLLPFRISFDGILLVALIEHREGCQKSSPGSFGRLAHRKLWQTT